MDYIYVTQVAYVMLEIIVINKYKIMQGFFCHMWAICGLHVANSYFCHMWAILKKK